MSPGIIAALCIGSFFLGALLAQAYSNVQLKYLIKDNLFWRDQYLKASRNLDDLLLKLIRKQGVETEEDIKAQRDELAEHDFMEGA